MKITMALVILTVIIIGLAFFLLGHTLYWPVLIAMFMSVVIIISWFVESRAVARRT